MLNYTGNDDENYMNTTVYDVENFQKGWNIIKMKLPKNLLHPKRVKLHQSKLKSRKID